MLESALFKVYVWRSGFICGFGKYVYLTSNRFERLLNKAASNSLTVIVQTLDSFYLYLVHPCRRSQSLACNISYKARSTLPEVV